MTQIQLTSHTFIEIAESTQGGTWDVRLWMVAMPGEADNFTMFLAESTTEADAEKAARHCARFFRRMLDDSSPDASDA